MEVAADAVGHPDVVDHRQDVARRDADLLLDAGHRDVAQLQLLSLQ